MPISDTDLVTITPAPGQIYTATVADLGNSIVTRARVMRTTKPVLTIIPLGTSITRSDNNDSTTLPALGGGSLTVNGCHLAGLEVLQNAGVAGDTVEQCAARLPAVLAQKPDAVLLECMTNSIVAAMNTPLLVQKVNILEAMVIACIKVGSMPILVVPPAKNGAAVEIALCRYFMYRMANYYGITLADLFNVTSDPATGNFKAGLSGDGVHPSGMGLAVCADEVAAAINAIRTHNGYVYYSAFDATTAGQAQNMLRNGCFSRSASPPTPDGMIVNTTDATLTLVPQTPSYDQRWAIGNTFRYDKTATGYVGAFQASAGNAVTAGDVIEMSGRVKFSGLTPGVGTGGTLQVSFSGPGSLYRPLYVMKVDGEYLFSSRATVPVGTTSIGVGLFTGDISLVEVNALTITNLTANELLWKPGLQ